MQAGRSAPPAGSAAVSADARSPFADVTREVGLRFTHENGMSGQRYFVEIMGAGAGFLDYDGDGDLDLYLVQGHRLPRGSAATADTAMDRLYRNDLQVRPDGGRTLRFTDVTAASGIQAPGYGMGVATGDYDSDGRVDLYVLNWGANQLWRNNGDGTFSDVTRESATGDPGWSTGAAFLDFDRDGWLDLMVVNYTRYTLDGDRPCYAESGRPDYCGPDAYPAQPDRLYRNLGNGAFEDVTVPMGLAVAYGPGLGVIAADFNGDGWPDIYVANDRQENQLWLNRNGERFVERAVMGGAAVNAAGWPEASMGVVGEDFDGDGDHDLFMTHLAGETNTLYVNSGDAVFEDRSRPAGLSAPSRVYTGFGVAPLDYDNDGWLDLFIANGAVTVIPEQADRGIALPLNQTNQLFRNLGRGRFTQVVPPADPVFEQAEVTRGVAQGDVDNDGDTDILISNNNGPARLLRNEVGQDRAWLGLRLLVAPTGRDALGARVAVFQPGRPTLWRDVQTGGSYASAHDPRLLIGLDDGAAPDSVGVHWLDGSVETWTALAPNRYHTLVRNRGQRRHAP